MKNLSTRYNSQEVENKWFDFWNNKGYFHAEVIRDKESYSIVIPPPNVTGILHMGHALNNIIQDILIRHKRMSGFNAEWTPGTDHAGIATQNVVEKELSKENKTRYDLGRDKFVDKVWEWTKENGGTIIDQLKRLGCSCDWQRERFTLDEDYSKAVNEAFIRLYKDKLIYRGSYIINWCPRCKTALSDEEAPHKEIQGNLYYIKYPLKNSNDYAVVATTRPETMFGDTALCVNPEDKRYKHLVGKIAILPIVNRELKIIEDAKVDPEFGTGIVKVTPLHDANDFELGNRHNLNGILCINTDGTMNENAAENYCGMDRFEARESLVEDLKERKLVEKIEPHLHAVGHCYRCHTMIEPYFSEQWFVRMKPLAKKALLAAERGEIKFYPKRWLKIYINWMENIRDWCISRQIWWGHRIPAWYCKNCYESYQKKRMTEELRLPLEISDKEAGIISVGDEKPKECPNCKSKDIKQDPDVLDTWFSSWLWPFAVYGWPFFSQQSTVNSQQSTDKTKSMDYGLWIMDKKDLDYFYPTSCLVTGSEIIFFWVARMIMAGLYFMKDIPFHDVYIHGTVRDEKGRKMSKSLGNAIDPQEIIDKHGADALRFSLISLPGEDLYLSKNKFEFGRNFTNKIWNASRFILMNLDGSKLEDVSLNEIKILLTKDDSHLAEEWILSKLNKLILDINEDFKTYRFDEISKRLHDFFWHKFCDWYIEIAKVNIEDEITQKVLFITLKTILKLMHPYIPFITEEIWQKLPRKTEENIMISKWPEANKQFINSNKEEQFNECLIKPIRIVRNFRMNHKLNSSVTIPQIVIDAQELKLKNIIRSYEEHIKKLARVGIVNVLETVFEKPVTSSIIKVQIPIEGLIDVKKEKIRLSREIDKKRTVLKELNGKLSNKRYLENAPKSDVEETKKRREGCSLEIEGLLKTLEELG